MNAPTLTAAIHDYGSAKEVARAVGCSEATAARYRRGETFPDPVGLARLMGRSRLIATAMLRLAGLDDLTMDLEEARLLRELHELQAKRGTTHAATTETAAGSSSRPVVGTGDTLADHTIGKMNRALDDSRRLR